MRTLFSLIALFTLVGSLVAGPFPPPASPPSVSDETLDLKALLQSLHSAMADKDETEVRTQGISTPSCHGGVKDQSGIITHLNKYYNNILDVEINCASSPTCTTITNYKGTSFYGPL